MKVREAPVWVVAYELALWLGQRADETPESSSLRRLDEGALTLLENVSVALTYRERRDQHLLHAREEAVRLRQRLTLARDRGALSARRAAFALERLELEEIGRMLGGWARRERGRAVSRNRASPERGRGGDGGAPGWAG